MAYSADLREKRVRGRRGCRRPVPAAPQLLRRATRGSWWRSSPSGSRTCGARGRAIAISTAPEAAGRRGRGRRQAFQRDHGPRRRRSWGRRPPSSSTGVRLETARREKSAGRPAPGPRAARSSRATPPQGAAPRARRALSSTTPRPTGVDAIAATGTPTRRLLERLQERRGGTAAPAAPGAGRDTAIRCGSSPAHAAQSRPSQREAVASSHRRRRRPAARRDGGDARRDGSTVVQAAPTTSVNETRHRRRRARPQRRVHAVRAGTGRRRRLTDAELLQRVERLDRALVVP